MLKAPPSLSASCTSSVSIWRASALTISVNPPSNVERIDPKTLYSMVQIMYFAIAYEIWPRPQAGMSSIRAGGSTALF
jgi:hypothetical protein